MEQVRDVMRLHHYSIQEGGDVVEYVELLCFTVTTHAIAEASVKEKGINTQIPTSSSGYGLKSP